MNEASPWVLESSQLSVNPRRFGGVYLVVACSLSNMILCMALFMLEFVCYMSSYTFPPFSGVNHTCSCEMPHAKHMTEAFSGRLRSMSRERPCFLLWLERCTWRGDAKPSVRCCSPGPSSICLTFPWTKRKKLRGQLSSRSRRCI